MVDGAFPNRSSSTPLHVQLAERLRQLIISGEYRPGERLSPESKLVERFGLSRVTVRSGLALPERGGWNRYQFSVALPRLRITDLS